MLGIWEALEQLENRELEPPFWAFAWPGGQALARFVLDAPGKFVTLNIASAGSPVARPKLIWGTTVWL